jgi:hypothetical protein
MALSLATAISQAQATLTTPTTKTSYTLTIIDNSLASKVVVFKDEGNTYYSVNRLRRLIH